MCPLMYICLNITFTETKVNTTAFFHWYRDIFKCRHLFRKIFILHIYIYFKCPCDCVLCITVKKETKKTGCLL
ncbi:hypothetical protein XENTR_v10000925 [Xenopus tropicalis]|nr:hypothetical protein XENTR_v10000925 [Xenopus tropicalis]